MLGVTPCPTFNVSISKAADDLAKEKEISFKIYNIIYELLEEIKTELEQLLDPECSVGLWSLMMLAAAVALDVGCLTMCMDKWLPCCAESTSDCKNS